MTQHLSTPDLEQHRARTLTPEELLRVDEHLSGCASCRQRFVELAELPVLSLSQWLESRDASDHLTYDEFAAFVDGTMAEVDREIADGHILLCGACADEVRNLLAFSHQISQTTGAELAGAAGTAFLLRWREWFGAFVPLRAATVAVAIVILVVSGWFVYRSFLPGKQPQVAGAVPADTLPPINSNQPAIAEQTPPGNNANQAVHNAVGSVNPKKTRRKQTTQSSIEPQSEIMITLADGDRRIILDTNGKLTGLEGLPIATQQAVKEALLEKNLFGDVIGSIMQLRAPPVRRSFQGVVRGGGLAGGARMVAPARESASPPPFELISPIGIIVQSDRPTLRWQALEGATSYMVAVFDRNSKPVASSERLSTTEWTLPAPLPRGEIYSWRAFAIRNEMWIESPRAQGPNVSFKVLEEAKAKEIEETRRLAPGSHLALGVQYARAGLIAEAEKEFRELANKNPDSPAVHQLLATAGEMHSRIEPVKKPKLTESEADANRQRPSRP